MKQRSTDPSPSAGCGKPIPKGAYAGSVQVGSTKRTYYVVPPTTSSTTPVSAVLVFHWGYDGTGVKAASNSEATVLGAEALHVFPDGVAQSWYGNTVGWDSRDNTSTDVKFVEALTAKLEAELCIDRNRYFAYGISWGGWMAQQLACAWGPKLRGFASIAGGGPNYPNDGKGTGCVGAVSGMIIHGTNDNAEPIAEAYKSRSAWQALNACNPTARPFTPSPCVDFACSKDPLVFCEWNGGHGHPDWGFATVGAFFKAQ